MSYRLEHLKVEWEREVHEKAIQEQEQQEVVRREREDGRGAFIGLVMSAEWELSEDLSFAQARLPGYEGPVLQMGKAGEGSYIATIRDPESAAEMSVNSDPDPEPKPAMQSAIEKAYPHLSMEFIRQVLNPAPATVKASRSRGAARAVADEPEDTSSE